MANVIVMSTYVILNDYILILFIRNHYRNRAGGKLS